VSEDKTMFNQSILRVERVNTTLVPLVTKNQSTIYLRK